MTGAAGATETVPVVVPPAVTLLGLIVKSNSPDEPGAVSVTLAFCTIPAPWKVAEMVTVRVLVTDAVVTLNCAERCPPGIRMVLTTCAAGSLEDSMTRHPRRRSLLKQRHAARQDSAAGDRTRRHGERQRRIYRNACRLRRSPESGRNRRHLRRGYRRRGYGDTGRQLTGRNRNRIGHFHQ